MDGRVGIGHVLAAFLMLAAAGWPKPALAAISAAERNTLIALYTAAGGNGWNDNTGWCSGTCPASGSPTFNAPGTECAGWYGVTCDATSTHVIAIGLSANDAIGTLPDLSALVALESFDASLNGLSGPLPPLSALANLQTFDVNRNAFSGSFPAIAALASAMKGCQPPNGRRGAQGS